MTFTEQLHLGYQNRKFDIDKRKTEDFIDHLFRFIFFLEYQRCSEIELIEQRLSSFKAEFTEILATVKTGNEEVEGDIFFEKFAEIYRSLENDAQYIFENDPAAQSVEEVMFSYPGFFAIAVYRLSHELFKSKIPLIPRIWTEYAHSKTGIDIHPGAEIGENFFIDHGTGIVIGETTVIGKKVKIYQGVTLGALSVTKDLQDQTPSNHRRSCGDLRQRNHSRRRNHHRRKLAHRWKCLDHRKCGTKFGGISQRTSHGEEQIPGK